MHQKDQIFNAVKIHSFDLQIAQDRGVNRFNKPAIFLFDYADDKHQALARDVKSHVKKVCSIQDHRQSQMLHLHISILKQRTICIHIWGQLSATVHGNSLGAALVRANKDQGPRSLY